jgi:hypothetical protein
MALEINKQYKLRHQPGKTTSFPISPSIPLPLVHRPPPPWRPSRPPSPPPRAAPTGRQQPRGAKWDRRRCAKRRSESEPRRRLEMGSTMVWQIVKRHMWLYGRRYIYIDIDIIYLSIYLTIYLSFYLYLCMYVCMNVCMYVCLYVCTYVRTYISLCLCLCICICIYKYIYYIHICV